MDTVIVFIVKWQLWVVPIVVGSIFIYHHWKIVPMNNKSFKEAVDEFKVCVDKLLDKLTEIEKKTQDSISEVDRKSQKNSVDIATIKGKVLK